MRMWIRASDFKQSKVCCRSKLEWRGCMGLDWERQEDKHEEVRVGLTSDFQQENGVRGQSHL